MLKFKGQGLVLLLLSADHLLQSFSFSLFCFQSQDLIYIKTELI